VLPQALYHLAQHAAACRLALLLLLLLLLLIGCIPCAVIALYSLIKPQLIIEIILLMPGCKQAGSGKAHHSHACYCARLYLSPGLTWRCGLNINVAGEQ